MFLKNDQNLGINKVNEGNELEWFWVANGMMLPQFAINQKSLRPSWATPIFA